jgi:hypothetical protein
MRGDDMSETEIQEINEKKQADIKGEPDETLKPISAEDLMPQSEELQETSARREWQIKRIQENLGVSRDVAEKMVDESAGSW